ncbi:MAG: glycosyltransferase family 2 protein [Bacilli bacterium]|nr:glycosyltransferase family 2 protein [Bacilli bacterium]MDD4407274.1 glycosyltransferase family 2 protein [Bacilli bacterium]
MNRRISILIPCYNEEKIIKNTVEGLLRIEYYNYECIFINDGSTDNTLKELEKTLKLMQTERAKKHNLNSKDIKQFYKSKKYRNMYVIDKENGGKSEALNCAITYSMYDYVVTLDADSILKKDALAIISACFDDPDVVAASGVIQILQSFKLSKKEDKTTLKLNYLLRLQAIEYIKSCYCYKASLAKLKSLLVISGAFGAFKKDILLEVNGFSHVIGEDLDLTLKIQFLIQNSNKKIVYMPEAICYTEGPETFKDYVKQRKRWQQSFIESLFSFKKIIFKNFFVKSLPFFMIVDALFLGIISSFIIVIFSLLAIINIINNNIFHILIYFLIFIAVHLTYNIAGISIAYHYNIKYKGIDFIRVIFTVILDIFFYRIVILYTIITGTISYFTNKRGWNKVNRSGRNYNVLKKEE